MPFLLSVWGCLWVNLLNGSLFFSRKSDASHRFNAETTENTRIIFAGFHGNPSILLTNS
ncbi:MAG: hypothetical protein RLZ25_779 [Pseudomonadota bacterium]